MYTRSVTLRRACVVKKSVRVGCGKKGFELSFFSKKKVGKFGRKRLRIFHAFFHRLIVPIFYGRRGKNGAFRNLVVHAALRLTRNIR